MAFTKYFFTLFIQLLSISTVLSWKHSTKSQFHSHIREQELSLVAFVAPWTEPSKVLEPEWISASKRAGEKLLSIDCTVDSDLCLEYGVISYPTIRLFQGDRMSRYKGPRKSSEILSFLIRAKLSSLSVLDNSNISAFRVQDKAVFIAYTSLSSSLLRTSFKTLAHRNHDKYTFGITTDSAVADSLGLTTPAIVCTKREDGEQEIFTGIPTEAALSKWVEDVTAPIIGEFTRRSEMKYMRVGKSIVYLFHHNEGQKKKLQNSLAPLAKRFKEYLSFVTVDLREYGHMLAAVGLGGKGKKDPMLAVFNPMFGQKFPFDGRHSLSEGNVESFVMDIVSGNIKPWDGGGGKENVVLGHDEM